MINVGVIGYGYWGPNLVRNFTQNPDTNVLVVCDRDRARLDKVSALYTSVKTTTDAENPINDTEIDAIVIATPVHSHFSLGMAALKAGKHVLIEKPIAASAGEARRLMEEAEKRGLIILVDHTFVYTGAVRKMYDLVRDKDFGDLRYYDSTRVNLGLFQPDVNVLWDLAVHDLSIMSYVMGRKPTAVSATGHAHMLGQPEHTAFLTVFFEDVIAHINVNWLSPVKIRRTLVGGSRKMIVYDDLETSEKIKLYDKGIDMTESAEDVRRLLISYRTGDMWSPKVADTEALAVEVAHFVDCIESRDKPISGADAGLELVRILEAADASMHAKGAPVAL